MIEKIVLEHEDRPLIPLIIHDILDEETNAIITDTNGKVIHSFHNGLNKERIENKVLSNSTFSSNPNRITSFKRNDDAFC